MTNVVEFRPGEATDRHFGNGEERVDAAVLRELLVYHNGHPIGIGAKLYHAETDFIYIYRGIDTQERRPRVATDDLQEPGQRVIYPAIRALALSPYPWRSPGENFPGERGRIAAELDSYHMIWPGLSFAARKLAEIATRTGDLPALRATILVAREAEAKPGADLPF